MIFNESVYGCKKICYLYRNEQDTKPMVYHAKGYKNKNTKTASDIIPSYH